MDLDCIENCGNVFAPITFFYLNKTLLPLLVNMFPNSWNLQLERNALSLPSIAYGSYPHS